MMQDLISSATAYGLLAGVGGAAALAATDWRSPLRFIQHVFVGTVASVSATPLLAPAIGKVLGVLAVDPGAHLSAAQFLTGAFSIYLFEYLLALWRIHLDRARKRGHKDGV